MNREASHTKLHVLKQVGARGRNPLTHITQNDLVEILTLEEEVRIIRHEILLKKLKLASALLTGATAEMGCHELIYDKKKRKVYVHAFRGAILRHPGDLVPLTSMVPQLVT